MDKKRLLELLAKRASGVISLPEARELNDFLNANQGEKDLSELLDHVFHGHFKIDSPYTSEGMQQQFKKIKAGIEVPEIAVPVQKKVFSRHKFFVIARAVAAVFLLSFGIWYYFTQYHAADPASKNIIATKKGSKSNLVLPDGTKVWLNADSKLIYEKSYGEKTRNVDLIGEAYFDVVKDKDRPFIVHTKAMDIKVLGTVFNVRAYDNEINTETTLIRGKVEVSLRNKSNEKIILKPNEKIIVKNNEFIKSKTPAFGLKNAPEMSVVNIQLNNIADSTANEIQWTKNRLVFDQTDFSEVIHELERWYGVRIVVKDSSVLERRLSGIFENESLPEVLESFKLAAGFNYRISDNILTIYK